MGQCNFLHLWHQKLYRAFRFGALWPISCSYPRHSQLTRHSLMLANGCIRQSLTALVNSVLQLIFSIFRNNSYTSPFNSTTEGTLLKCMLQTAHNACNSKDVDALKFQIVRHDILYNGQNQQDSTGCFMMLINIIDKGSMPDSSSTTSPMGASLSDLLFSFVLEKYIVCEVCGLRSPSFESISVLHISPTDTPSMQNLILEGLQQRFAKILFSMQ